MQATSPYLKRPLRTEAEVSAAAGNPEAIDLDRLYAEAGSLNPVEKALAAAVEALRERNTVLTRKNGERAKWASEANERADAAEARESALELELASMRQ